MEQILIAYGLPRKTVTAIMMLYKRHKSKSTLTRWRHISTIPVHYLPRLHILDVDRFNEIKWLYTGKGKKQTIPALTIMDVDYTDDSASDKYTSPG